MKNHPFGLGKGYLGSRCTHLITLSALAFIPFASTQNSASSSTLSSSARPGSGQDITFEQIFLEQGLSQSIVKGIVQDSNGFIWFATEDGLNRFDGYKFKVLRHDPDDPDSLSFNDVTAVHVDRGGVLWVGTFYGGLNQYVREHQRFIRYLNDPRDRNSLSNDHVNTIYEDRSGALWIGTDDGLNQLVRGEEGVSPATFIRFLNDPNASLGPGPNTVRAICEDKAGALWFGTDQGLSRLDRGTGRFTHYGHDPKDPNSLSHNEVYAVLEDHDGVLWVGTRGGGLNRLVSSPSSAIASPGTDGGESDGGKVTPRFISYLHRPGDPDSLSHNDVNVIFEDRTGTLWLGTNGGGLNLFDRESERFVSYQHDPYDAGSLSYDEVMAIYEDRSGLLWIGTYGGGIDKIDRGKKQFALYRADTYNPNSLSQRIVWAICEDKSGILWIGTHGGGLNRLRRDKDQYTFYRSEPNDPSSLSSDIVRFVYEDRAGTLWIGTHGGGLCEFDRDTEIFRCYRHDAGDPLSISHDELRSIYEDRSGTLWIGTNGGGLNKFVPSSEPGSRPTFVRYRHEPNNPKSLSNDFVRVIFEDREGRFWIGTQGGGLNKFEREAGTFSHYRANLDDPEALNNDYIFSIYEDGQGGFWLGTWGGGLNRFDRVSGRFSHYTEDDGLADDSIYGIMEDEQGNLWLSTNNGLSKFNPQEETFRNYSVDDGLQGNEFNGGAYFKSESGEMFFGGIEGFNAFHPAEIKDNPHIPPVVITTFQKLNKDVKFDRPTSDIEKVELSYKDYVFSFEFSALDFTAPEKNQYAYKMEGLDEDWVYTDSTKRFATYTTLAPGTYVFRVKGANNDGVWNEEGTSLEITITPPFWKTWWFTLLWAVFGLAAAVVSYKRRLKTERMKTELQAAHDAQMSIMPQVDPQLEGLEVSGDCIPASEVGGDFFDYVWLNKKSTRVGIAIGDVSGKAMKSAMTAVMSSGILYSIAEEDIPVKEIMTRVNRPMFVKTDSKMFTALCLVSLDTLSRELVFVNAGLEHPLLKSGGSTAFVRGVGPRFPLGMIRDTAYEEKGIPLESGDVWVFYTDGVSEAQNHAKELYGEATLQNQLQKIDTAALSAQQIKEEILTHVRRFVGGAPQHDDMTVVVVKVI